MLEYRFRIKHVVNGKDQMIILCDENADKIDQVKHLQTIEYDGEILVEELIDGKYITHQTINLTNHPINLIARINQFQARITRMNSNRLHNANPIHHAEEEIAMLQAKLNR
tara:strand:- start:7 stop:339 length:333 start_codon:yes stop_codon:yes gene_type:complete